MAGMPRSLLERATEILHELESKNLSFEDSTGRKKIRELKDLTSFQLNIFDQTDAAIQQMKDDLLKMDINQMTPIECMMALLKLKKMIDN